MLTTSRAAFSAQLRFPLAHMRAFYPSRRTAHLASCNQYLTFAIGPYGNPGHVAQLLISCCHLDSALGTGFQYFSSHVTKEYLINP